MLITGREVERRLAITPQERQRLAATQVIPPVGRIGSALAYDETKVDEIANRGEWIAVKPVLAVRLGEPQADQRAWRDWLGWDDTWDEVTKRRAAQGLWPVANASELAERRATLVAVVAIVIVGAWQITSASQVEPPRWLFEVASHPDRQSIVGHQLRLGGGPLVRTWL